MNLPVEIRRLDCLDLLVQISEQKAGFFIAVSSHIFSFFVHINERVLAMSVKRGHILRFTFDSR